MKSKKETVEGKTLQEIGEIKLYDRADGSKGHYCIGRLTASGFHEYWTGKDYSGFGKLYTNEQDAQQTADLLIKTEALQKRIAELEEEVETLRQFDER